MRILQIITTIEIGGAEKQLVTLTRNLSKHNNEIVILYLKGKNSLRSELLESGASAVYSSKNILRFISYILSSSRRPQVVHAHLPRAEILGVLVSKLIGAKLIISKHNCEPPFPKMPQIFQLLLVKKIESQASAFVAISNQVSQFLKDTRIISSDAKLTQIYYAIDERYCKEETLQQEVAIRSPFSAVVLSRLVEQKNLTNLLNAINMSRAVVKRVEIYGEGILYPKLEKMIHQLALEEKVVIKRKETDIYKVLQESDLMFLVSFYEGFGLALLEAMQVGLPVIASRIPVFEEILGENYPLFVDPHSPKSMSEMMEEVSNFQIRSILEIYQNRLRLFDSEANVKQIYQLYEKLLSI